MLPAERTDTITMKVPFSRPSREKGTCSHHLQLSSLQVPVRSNRQKHFDGSMVLLYVTELKDNFSLVL